MLATLNTVALFMLFGGMALWFLGIIILSMWVNARTKQYLTRFPPVDGVPLHWLNVSRFDHPSRRQVVHDLVWNWQEDQELEALRQAMWRRARVLYIWMFAPFALVVVALIVLALWKALS